MAIQHAQRVCDWMENLSSEERPPAWMWPFEEELEIWFDEVDKERKERYESHSQPNDESSGWVSNELAKGRGK